MSCAGETQRLLAETKAQRYKNDRNITLGWIKEVDKLPQMTIQVGMPSWVASGRRG